MPGFDRAPGQRPARSGREAGIDPVCHTLFGAALSRSGLGKRTAWGTTALIVGANLPDVDILAVWGGPLTDLEWRRGWTHGVLALVVLPLLLTLSLGMLQRIRPGHSRGIPFRQDQLLLLATIAIVSHPILDTLNTYGVRWLMPFSGRWFYGDALFIVDPWAWITLGAGVWWSWRRRRKSAGIETRPAQWAIALFVLYAGCMWASGAAARSLIRVELEARSGQPVRTAMAGPLPLTVFSRSFVARQEEQYLVGTFRWLPRPGVIHDEVRPFSRARPSHPAFDVALARQEFRRFLGWARFPTFIIEPAGSERYLVHAVDLRYTRRPGARFGSVTVAVSLPSQAVSLWESRLRPSRLAFTYCIQNTLFVLCQ